MADIAADDRGVRTLLATLAVVLSISGAVLYASEAQRSVAELNFQEAQTAKEMAVELLARNATLQRHLSDGGGSALDLLPFFAGDRQVDEALARARRMSSDDEAELREIDTQERAEEELGGPRGGRTQARGQGAARGAAPIPSPATRHSTPSSPPTAGFSGCSTATVRRSCGPRPWSR